LFKSFLSTNSAAFRTINLHYLYNYLELTRSLDISANLNCKYWKSDNFFPNCLLEFKYFFAAYKQNEAPPKEQLAILIRPPSNAFIAILNPVPSYPILLEAGTLTLSKVTRAVGCIVHPIFYYFFPYSIPLLFPSTIKQDISVADVFA
jgi:hypothetical protein